VGGEYQGVTEYTGKRDYFKRFKVLELEMLSVSIRKKLTKKLDSVNSGKDGAGNVIVEKKGSSEDVEGMQVKPFWLAEKQIIESAIENCDGNVHLAAKKLEISASTIYRKVKNWELGEI